MLRRDSVAWGVVVSLALHGVWIGTLEPQRADRAAHESPAVPYSVTIGVLTSQPTASQGQRPALSVPALPGGPRSESALDTDQREGRGGTPAAAERSALLFSFASPITLQDTELNSFAVSQTQRIDTAPTRATQEERRATPSAADATFLASGSRGHRERRKPAPRDARDGAPAHQQREAALASTQAHAGKSAGQVVVIPQEVAPASAESAARGILLGAGQRASEAARVAHARPNVDRGPAATPAQALDKMVSDNVDAELLAASLQRSIVDSSTQRAAKQGAGYGGVIAPEQSGLSARGRGAGSRALPYLPGPGDGSALDTSDARYVRWFTEQRKRVQDELFFPRPRALAKDQGVSIFRVVVRRDGRLSGSPHMVRSSGFADFDEAAVVAIRRAVPFSPLPERLVPESRDVTVLIPIAFSNPMVQ